MAQEEQQSLILHFIGSIEQIQCHKMNRSVGEIAMLDITLIAEVYNCVLCCFIDSVHATELALNSYGSFVAYRAHSHKWALSHQVIIPLLTQALWDT